MLVQSQLSTTLSGKFSEEAFYIEVVYGSYIGEAVVIHLDVA